LALSTSAVAQAQPSAASAQVQADSQGLPAVQQAEYARLGQELQAVTEALADKKKELARLRHKWLVAKGRTPSAEELKEFEKKRAKGNTTVADNPYINKNPLSAPAYARTAYYKKLEEIRQDEERISRLEKARAGGDPGAGAAGAGAAPAKEVRP
jgi:hypothetical protein